jgi:hypothetical protein
MQANRLKNQSIASSIISEGAYENQEEVYN